ncbi:MAG TPA: molybdenum cofactor guanylyltransferase MobA [Gammaproteobacteria bacterium]|nr:molybdenum cofactor guanylyltransferase MobA [Gammaproteobacteria bacterium]
MTINRDQITAVILAGGKGRRMGGQDKGLLELKGRPLIKHVLSAIAPQVGTVIINANRNLNRYAGFGYPVVRDDLQGFQGPLAGFAAAMAAATTPYILTMPCDGPLLPVGYARTMADALESSGAELAVAHSGERLQPVHALLCRSLEPSLLAYLESGDRKIDLWYRDHRMAIADFSHCPEAFRNINTPDEREHLMRESERPRTDRKIQV